MDLDVYIGYETTCKSGHVLFRVFATSPNNDFFFFSFKNFIIYWWKNKIRTRLKKKFSRYVVLSGFTSHDYPFPVSKFRFLILF